MASTQKFPPPPKRKKEFEWYESPRELKRAGLKLFILAAGLFFVWFIFECWRNWNIFS